MAWTRSHWVQPLVELRIERHGMNCIGFPPKMFNRFHAVPISLIFDVNCAYSCNQCSCDFLPNVASSVLHLQLLVDLWKQRSRQRTGWNASSPQCRLDLIASNHNFVLPYPFLLVEAFCIFSILEVVGSASCGPLLWFHFFTRHCRQEVPAEVPAATEGLTLRYKKNAKGFRLCNDSCA